MLLLFSGCEQNGSFTREKLIGKWRFESTETNGEISPVTTTLVYWEFLSTGDLIITEGTYINTNKWDLIDSKIVINNNLSSYYTVLKLTNKKLDVLYEGESFTSIYHLVKVY